MDRSNFHNRIKQYRTRLGLSQSELAELVGCSRNTISSLELGTFNASAFLAYHLCQVFHCKFSDLFYYDAKL